MNKISKELIELCEKEYRNKPLIVPIGTKDYDENVYMDLTNIAGIFITGTTGTGKSNLLDFIIHSLMYKNKPSDISFYLIDPKKIELNEYNDTDYVIDGKSISEPLDIEKHFHAIEKIIDDRIEHHHDTKYKEKLAHIFVVVDEGYDVYNNSYNREILEKILNYGNKIKMHLLFATNSYLKDYVKNGFINRFKYRITFDLASIEQAKYIGINNSSWLGGRGEARIKGINSTIYKLETYKAPDEEINDILLHSKK